MSCPEDDLHLGATVGALTTLALGLAILAIFGHGVGLLQILNTAATFVIAAGVYFTYRQMVATERRHLADRHRAESETFLREAITSLERAHGSFTERSSLAGVPPRDRLVWLVVARMLLRYAELKERTTERDHRLILLEQEQFWRHAFYVVLDTARKNLDDRYFNEAPPIEARSVLAIYDFARWPPDYPDPIDQVDKKVLKAEEVIPINHFGARRYLGVD